MWGSSSVIDHQTEGEKARWSPPTSQKMGLSQEHLSILLLPPQRVRFSSEPLCCVSAGHSREGPRVSLRTSVRGPRAALFGHRGAVSAVLQEQCSEAVGNEESIKHIHGEVPPALDRSHQTPWRDGSQHLWGNSELESVPGTGGLSRDRHWGGPDMKAEFPWEARSGAARKQGVRSLSCC